MPDSPNNPSPDPPSTTTHHRLHARHAPILDSVEHPSRRPPLRLALQGLGFVIGLALLGWVLSIALDEKNRPTLEKIADAHPALLAALFALTALAIVINGAAFRVVLAPLRRLPLTEIVAINAISTFLSILPFKISIIVRVLYHHRRDGVPLRDIVSWFAAMGACGLAILVPLFAVSLWRQSLDTLWITGALLGTAGATALAIPLARLARSRLPILHRLSLGADRILIHTRVVAAQYLLRILDLATVAARFYVAAAIVQLDLPVERAVLLGATYFLIAVLSPASALGFTEIGTVAVGNISGLDPGAVALVALAVTLSNILTAGAASVPAFLWLRPDRILTPRPR